MNPLPELYLITGDPADQPGVFLRRLSGALKRGIRLVQLRAKILSEQQLLSLYHDARRLCRLYEATVLFNGTPAQAVSVQADGVHLTAPRLLGLQQRPSGRFRIAASVHNSTELRQAERLGLDFVVVGPVTATASHPGSPVLGWPGFADLIAHTTLPVYAFGGVAPDDLATAQAYGAYGIAAIRALWGGDESELQS